MRFIKGLLLFVLVVVVILAVVLGGGYLYLTRRAFPQTDGTVQIPGLRAPVTIVRDKSGIPHIYAANTHDLFMAQGYVQAQDRLWQMESFRAGIAGTTSQLQPSIGNLEADKFVRTLGWRRAAEADYRSSQRRNQGDSAGFCRRRERLSGHACEQSTQRVLRRRRVWQQRPRLSTSAVGCDRFAANGQVYGLGLERQCRQ